MARRCDVCQKGVMHGHRKVHKHSKGWRYRAPKTNREWVPNLRKVKITTETTIKMCMACYRKYQVQGLEYIQKKNPRLYKKLAK